MYYIQFFIIIKRLINIFFENLLTYKYVTKQSHRRLIEKMGEQAEAVVRGGGEAGGKDALANQNLFTYQQSPTNVPSPLHPSPIH